MFSSLIGFDLLRFISILTYLTDNMLFCNHHHGESFVKYRTYMHFF